MTRHKIADSRVKQCRRDVFRLPSPVEEDVMNKSLRLETQKNVEALPHWEKFTAGLDGLGVVTAYREILGRAAATAIASLSNIDVVIQELKTWQQNRLEQSMKLSMCTMYTSKSHLTSRPLATRCDSTVCNTSSPF
jgi:hypothetical protein